MAKVGCFIARLVVHPFRQLGLPGRMSQTWVVMQYPVLNTSLSS